VIVSNLLNQFDVAFVLDTTGSMGEFISQAKQNMKNILSKLVNTHEIDLRVGVIEYRDHPPQETSFVTKVHRFSASIDTINNTIKQLTPSGGGDAPEAVVDGIIACAKLPWRKHACRMGILIGDAPPHGTSSHDYWQQCPCGETITSASCALENHSIQLFAIPLTSCTVLKTAFQDLCGPGGQVCNASNHATNAIEDVLKNQFGNIQFDQKVLEAHKEQDDPYEIARQLKTNLETVYQSLGRLGSRQLLNCEAVVV
jgi:hypothetical protein